MDTLARMLRRDWLVVALIVVFAGIYTQYVFKLANSEHGNRSAFLRWRPQLLELDDGVNIWAKHAYPNPPVMALVLMPFAHLPPLVGASFWFAVKAGLGLASIMMILRLLDTPARPFPLWGKTLAVVLCLRPIEGDLVHGNVNLVILFLLAAFAWAFCHRHDRLAGWLLGLSIACKLTPALFLPYLLWKRAWPALLTALLSVIVFGLIVPAAALGWRNNLDYLQSWHRHLIAPYAAGVVTSEHQNQSLPGLLHRMLREEASFSDYDGDRKIVLETHNIASWDRTTVQGIVAGCMALFAVIAMVYCRTPLETRPRLQLLAEFSVVVLGMLLFCERTWKHHGVILLLPFAVLAHGVSARLFSLRVRWGLGAVLGVATLLMLATSTGIFDQHLSADDRLGKLAQVYGAYVWAFLVLLAGMIGVLHGTAKHRPATYDDEQEPRRSDHVQRCRLDTAERLADADDGGAARAWRARRESQDDAGCLPDEPQFTDDGLQSEEQPRPAAQPE